jgi:hypothetical protein
MTMTQVGRFMGAAGLGYWPAARKKQFLAHPKQKYLATLLLVCTNASINRNYELYEATIKEILCLMSKERWERAEIEWRMRQAILIAKEESSPEVFERVLCVGQKIARWTIRNPRALPWVVRPFIKLLAQSQAKLAAKTNINFIGHKGARTPQLEFIR